MGVNDKIQYLIVDTSAFIRNAPLQVKNQVQLYYRIVQGFIYTDEIGVNVITEEDVVNEITNKRQLRRLVVLPYDLDIQSVCPENIKIVIDFAKKTGDYTSLSATDIKVIALTYQLEKEKVGTEHLKDIPTITRTIETNIQKPEDQPKSMVGFYMPQNTVDSELNEENINSTDSCHKVKEINVERINIEKPESKIVNHKNKEEKEVQEDVQAEFAHDAQESSESNESESDYETAGSDIDTLEAKSLLNKFAKLTCEPSEFKIESKCGNEYNIDEILPRICTTYNTDHGDSTKSTESVSDEFVNVNRNEEDDSDIDDESNNESDDENDDNWITPKNINMVKKQIDSDVLQEKPATVACLTTDFAMQNVLMQIGLNVASLDGRVIKQMRTFILRCYACFKTTSITTKVFCPNCGYKTLKKVAISLDDDGKQRIYINARKPLTARGKKFSLPTPKGGKHANNPILCEDQPLPHQRPTRLARTKNDPLQDDYIAGYSPFLMRDVNSKSAMLGIRPGGSVKHWMRRNPNEPKAKRK